MLVQWANVHSFQGWSCKRRENQGCTSGNNFPCPCSPWIFFSEVYICSLGGLYVFVWSASNQATLVSRCSSYKPQHPCPMCTQACALQKLSWVFQDYYSSVGKWKKEFTSETSWILPLAISAVFSHLENLLYLCPLPSFPQTSLLRAFSSSAGSQDPLLEK